MARPVTGCPISWPQQEDTEELETNHIVPQQEEQLDAAEGKVIADYDLDIDYEGSEPKNEPVTQEEKDKDPNAECASMKILCTGTFCQRMILCNVLKSIQWVQRE